MQKKDYYTLKEIILGLRKEYMIQQQKLQALKQYCDANRKKLVDYDFSILHVMEKNPVLFCDYVPKNTKGRKILIGIGKKMGFPTCLEPFSSLLADDDGYRFKKTKFPVHIKPDSLIEFSKHADSILKNEFSNGIKTERIEDNSLDANASLKIASESIYLFIEEKYGKIPSSAIFYDSKKDILKIDSFDEPMDKQSLEAALDIAFPCQGLNEYHINTISNSEESEKPLYLEEFASCSKANFDIQNKGNQYVLRRI